jgi:hypothetical protein
MQIGIKNFVLNRRLVNDNTQKFIQELKTQITVIV